MNHICKYNANHFFYNDKPTVHHCTKNFHQHQYSNLWQRFQYFQGKHKGMANVKINTSTKKCETICVQN